MIKRYRLLVYDKRLGEKGAILTLDEADAAWYNRDRACEALVEITEARAVDAPPRDRMVRKTGKRGVI